MSQAGRIVIPSRARSLIGVLVAKSLITTGNQAAQCPINSITRKPRLRGLRLTESFIFPIIGHITSRPTHRLKRTRSPCPTSANYLESITMQSKGDSLSAASNVASAFSRKRCSTPRIPNTAVLCSAGSASCACQTNTTTKPTDVFPSLRKHHYMLDWWDISVPTRNPR